MVTRVVAICLVLLFNALPVKAMGTQPNLPYWGINLPPRQKMPISPAGIEFINQYKPLLRVNFNWAAMEKKRGKFVVTPKLDYFRKEAQKARTKFAIMLGYNHPSYAPGCENHANMPRKACTTKAVTTETNIRGFEAYVKYLFDTMARETAIWEIWNEPNVPNYWKSGSNPTHSPQASRDYAIFLGRIAKLIKSLDPNAFVVSGGTAAVDLEFIQDIIDSGAHKYIDSFGIHINQHRIGEVRYYENKKRRKTSLPKMVARLENHFSRYSKPFTITEFGFPLYSSTYDNIASRPLRSRTLQGEQQKQLIQSYNILKQSKAIDGIFIFSLEDTLKKHNVKRGALAKGDQPVYVPAGFRGLIDAKGVKKDVFKYLPKPEKMHLRRP